MSKIAIIGMSGLFPGSSTLEQFWNNLIEAKDLTGLATEEDFGQSPSIFFEDGKGVVDKCYSTRGGYIRDFHFEPGGYALDADYLSKQDKLYQWSLHVAKEALAHSGYLKDETARKNCGLVLGNLSFPTGSSHKLLSRIYSHTLEQSVRKLLGNSEITIPGHVKEMPDNRVLDHTPSELVAKALSLGKTHYALDAACATSLYAIKLACDELQTGKADFMLAGAVCGSDQLFIHMGFSIFHAYAPMDQKFVPLDKNSAGLVSAEGAGIVVLKRLEDAERDGDKILGVIGGIGLSNDGRGKFLLSPNPKGQKLAFQRAYDFKEIFPKDTTYLECHATGTPLGDVTEMNSIADFFQKHQTQPALGSVKSNMGHLLTAAGMSGLLKVLLAMEKEVIPPNINLTDAVEADNGWLTKEQMILQAQAWNDTNKQAGINSFGFGGTNAHMVVQNYKGLPNASKSIEKASDQQLKPMSIIGMDVHFGDCTSLDEFYQTIFSGRQHFRELPPQRWKGFEENEALLKAFGFADGKPPKSAYIDHFEIDLLRYKIQPKEAETLEPQQALMLKVADNALKDAGLDESQNVAVLIAMESELAIHHYLARWDVGWQLEQALAESGIDLTEEQKNKLQELARNMMYYREGSQSPSQHTSFVGNIMASRIAALWDFNGPAFTISCGENSVFKALEVAQNLLSQGEVDAVVVGGVDFSAGFENVLLRNQYSQVNQAAAPSLPHNEGESGWLIGEGAGAIVLRASDAVLHTDTVYAKISGIGQQETSIDAGLIELAATGFAAQDEAELKQLLSNSPQQATALGSVKSNIGHTFAASGIASLIKVALCLHHRFIPAVPNWKAPKQLDDFAAKTYYFPSQSRPWISSSERKALVYGLEGLQVEVSEVANTQERSNQSSSFFRENMPALIPLLGQSEADLQRQLSALDVAIESEANLASIAQHFYQKYAEQKVASEAGFCLVITGKNKTSISKDIHYFQKTLGKTIAGGKTSKTPSGSYFTARPLGKKGKLAFVYPGSGTAYTGIGQALFQLFPALHGYYGSMVDDLNAYVHSEKVHPQTLSADTKADSALEKDAIALMSVGVFYAAAYTHILRHYFKIEPDVAFGYSMGECSSMWYALGLWDPRHAHIFQNSPIFKDRFAGKLELLAEEWNISTVEAQQRWASYSVLAPRSKVEEAVKQYERVYLTFINTEKEVVIAGDKTQCQAVIQQLDCHSIQLPFQNIIHNDFCNKERSGLLEMHDFQLENQPNIEFYSSLSLAPLPFDRKVIAENSTAVCHQLVDFPRLVKAVAGKGNAKLFVELGAHATCTGWIKETLKDQEHLANSMNQRGKSDVQSLSEVLAQLLSHGVEMDVSYLYAGLGEEKAQRTFAKKIIPGGHRIYDYMLTDQHQQLFASYATVTKSKALVESVSTRQLQAASTTFMESNIIERETGGGAISQSDKRIGENGLILQDYAAGEHLEGKEIIFSQEDLEEFAAGKISKVFGPEYSIIDSYSRRVMLPMHPYLLVSRVTGLRGQINQYKPSFMQTEYDIPYNAWFTTDGQIPWAVSVESGQCDLLLISYLGIDFQNKGDLVYRLLDCTLTFVDDLPFEGQTLRYDISINSFVRNGDNLLFFFSYRCYVQDRLVLKMDGGCAGFFTDEQLEEGNGVVYTDEEISKRKNAVKRRFTPLLKTDKTQFSKEDLQHLINNEPEKCFGDISYYRDGRNPSLCLPPEKILMIDRITQVDIHGGAYGLGFIEAEKDLHPDDWFFPCHFRDDEV
ncbi:MAG: PfaB family protein, partial [Bacteroidota bacterium]